MPRYFVLMRAALLVLLCCSSALILNAQEPTIATCDGDQDICLTSSTYDLCVEITVEPGFPFPIDSFHIDFGDGSPFLFVPGSNNPLSQQHLYDLSGFYNQGLCSQEYVVRLYTYYTENGTVKSVSTATFPAFFNPPNASFSLNPSTICVGQQVNFINNSFPICSLVSEWDYGDGTTGTDPFHTYNTLGDYQITLTVDNPCENPDMATQTLSVIEFAVSNPTPEPGYIDLSSQPYIVCMEAGASSVTIPLNGDSLSLNESTYQWGSLNGYPCASWLLDPPSNDPTPNVPDPSVVFCDTGLYLIILQVDNACNVPDFDTLFFQVVSGEALDQPNQPDACLSLNYQPNPFNTNASYTINGVPQTTFPVLLGIGDYTVVCFLSNECGDQTTTDQFFVTAEPVVSIALPASDTLCPGSDLVFLNASPEDGLWTGSNNIVIINDTSWFSPITPGEVAFLTYTVGPPGCQDSDNITITVEDTGLTANDYEVCPGDPTFLLEANQLVNNWSSMDCPTCIVNDSFVVSEMEALGLSVVTVLFESTSTSFCASAGSLTVTLNRPVATFTIPATICTDELLIPNTTGSIYNSILWRIDGVPYTFPPNITLPEGTHVVEMVSIVGACRDSMNESIVSIAPPPIVAFMATPLEGCADLEVNLALVGNAITGVSYNWYLDGILFSTVFNPGPVVLSQGLSDTTYTFSLSAGNGCGGENASQTVVVHPQPIANFGTNQNEYCSGDTVSFGNASFGEPDSLLWIFHDGTTYNGFDPPDRIYFTDTVPALYPITLIAMNDCGMDTITQEILINPTDVNAFFNTDPTTACVGDPICFESFSTFGAGVLFDFGDGNTNTNPNPCHIYDEPGMYQVTLKAFGCGFDSVFTMVEIFSLPFVSILNDDIVCPGEAISFVADVDNVVDYFWDFGDGSTTTLSEPEHAFAMPGTYSVSLIGFSIDSCAYKDSVMITIVGAPIAGFQAVQDSLCSGDMVTFNNLSSPDVETCFWDFGDGNFSNVCSPTHIYLAPDNYTVTLMVTNNSGCTDTLSQIVNIFAAPLPMFDFVLDQECTPAILTIINSSINAQSYSWDFGNGDTSTDTNPTTTYNLGGDYMIQLTAMNGLCERGISLPLTIYQTPEPIMALSDDVACAPATIIFEAIDSTPDLIYEWDFGDGLTAFDSLTTHTFTDPETYTIQLTISSSNCKDSISQEIIINPPVEINAEGTDILCFGQLTGAINISVISGTAPFQYDWSNGIITEDQGSIGAGAYQLTVTDSNGCFLEELFTLTEPLPITATLVDSSIVTCYGGDDGSVCIEVSGGVAAYTILWENNIEESCIDNMVADQYEVSITDANNCTEISIFEVFEHPPIEVIDTAINISCFGFADGQILLDTITGGVSDFYNTILEGPVSYTGGMSFSDLLPGNYHLMVQDLEGCLFETDYIIGEPDSLWLNIREDSLFIGMGDSIEIESAHNADMPLLAWSPATALSCADCEDPFASPLSTTTYVLNLIDQNGCIAIDTVLVLVDPNRQFYIPNTFTPNGDGRNDVFRIRSRLASIQQVNIFRVFDRWGEMVFESSSFRPQDERLEDAWDGTFRGRLLNPDTYVFYVEVIYLDGETEIEEGTVTLIR